MSRSIPSLCLSVFLAGACSGGPEPSVLEAPKPSVAASQNTTDEPMPARVAIRHILIGHDDSKRKHAMVSRSHAEATDLAKDLKTRIESGESMAQLAKRYSNDPTAGRGGFLGASERGAWVPEFERAAFALGIGEVSGPVETVYGIHVLRREPLEEIRLSHILVAHKDAKGVAEKRSSIGQRTPTEALQRANAALSALENGGAFTEIAAEYSDGPMGKRGAHLGWFVRGELGPAFDREAFSIDVGETSPVFQSVFGYHIIRREE